MGRLPIMNDDPISNVDRNGVERRERPLGDRASLKVITIAVAIAATVCALDLLMPLGVAGGVPYVALVFVGWWFPQRRTIFFLAVVSSVLTVAGYYFSPEGGVSWIVLTNRFYALFAIWGTAITLWTARQSRALVLQSEANLKYARNSAEAANRAKSDLLANMSHELRTPLNAIIGFSDTMINEVFGEIGNERYAEYTRDIHDSGKHLLDLINDILDVSAIEAGKLELRSEPLETEQLLDACMKLVKHRADTSGVTLERHIEKDLPNLLGDGRRVKQILLNLLSNAVKFTPENGKVTVSICTATDGGMRFMVEDTGIGMDETGIEIALAKFGQVDSDLTRKYEGTGLGLPLTKSLVEAHQGTMDIRSRLGSGTTVEVRFPPERSIPQDKVKKAVH